MHHALRLSIKRNGVAAVQITRTEWHQYILKNPTLSLGPPREGINHFTKQPMTFRPNKGLAFFETPSGRSSIEYIHDGELVANLAGPDAMDVVAQVAQALEASVRPITDDGVTGGA